MRVLTVSCFAPLWKRYPVDVLDLEDGPTIGGGEEGFIRTAAGLRSLGHEVVAYHCGERGVWRGVEFRTIEDPLYPVIVGEKWDAVCAWSGLRPLEYAPPGAKRLLFQQLNDLVLLGDWGCVDAIVSPSSDHAKMLKRWGWMGKAAVVHNGADLDAYADAPAWDARPYDVGYWSSPDRGLHHLLRAWPLVTRTEPRARLHVFYEIKRYLEHLRNYPINFYGERGQQVARLILERLHDPSVIFHGSVPRKALARVQKQCRVQCYPYETFAYCEGFATAVCQGLAAGCSVLATPRDALPSLYRDGIHWMDDLDFLDSRYPESLAFKIVAALRGGLPSQDATRARAKSIVAEYDWSAAARQMESACAGQSWFEPRRREKAA